VEDLETHINRLERNLADPEDGFDRPDEYLD